jgi:tRNA nucleotidyltransferase (CCA-adding enzyme)
MIDLIQKHRSDLEELCRTHDVKMLAIFGSAAEGTFDAERSDLDFLVDFLLKLSTTSLPPRTLHSSSVHLPRFCRAYHLRQIRTAQIRQNLSLASQSVPMLRG